MKGFDRPLKPLWIYQFIQEVEIGDKIYDHRKSFDSILWELDGDVGKRKVITVLSRYFLKTAENPKGRIVEEVPIIKICKKYPYEQIKPLILFHLLMRSKIIRILTKMIYEIYGDKNNINPVFLRKKVIEKFGEKDISARSLRNLLSTLVDFGVLEKEEKNYNWKTKLPIDESNSCNVLKLYSLELKGSPQINLDDMEDYLFLYFRKPDFGLVAKKYNGVLWDYNIRMGQKIIMFHDDVFDLKGVFK
jgi:hypothetical protein